MGKETDKAADMLAECSTIVDIPHPARPGKRIIGWVVDDSHINIGVSNLAIRAIGKSWSWARKFADYKS